MSFARGNIFLKYFGASRTCQVGPPLISWRIFWAILRFFSTIRIKNNLFGYGILREFATNEWIRRLDIRIFRDFGANEWIRRPDIRTFPDFATGTFTWYWYSICAPDPYMRILGYSEFISRYLSDIWIKNIGYFQPWQILNHRIFKNRLTPKLVF
jgi:hypothetical protein